MGEYIEVIGACIAGLFLCYLYWRDPYRKKARKIMDTKKRKTDLAPMIHKHHHSH